MKLPLLAIALAVPCYGQQSDRGNPAASNIPREAPCAISMPFPTQESAVGKDRLESPWCFPLDGEWKKVSASADELRYEFAPPEGFENRRTHITFEAAPPGFRAWINGRELGKPGDFLMPADFDITDALQAGDNVLAIRSQGSPKGVYIWSADTVALGDFWIQGGLADDMTTGTLEFSAKVVNKGTAGTSATVILTLTSSDGKRIRMAPVVVKIPAGGAAEGSVEIASVPGVKPWSADSPGLYQYNISLADSAGKEMANHSGRTGFRRDEMRGALFFHNGRQIEIKEPKGDETHGDLRADLLRLKGEGINTIRSSAYSNDPALFDLCDELGIHVVAESPTSRIEDVRNLMERCKNHPCVIMWSAGGGEISNAWLRQRDPSRPVR